MTALVSQTRRIRGERIRKLPILAARSTLELVVKPLADCLTLSELLLTERLVHVASADRLLQERDAASGDDIRDSADAPALVVGERP